MGIHSDELGKRKQMELKFKELSAILKKRKFDDTTAPNAPKKLRQTTLNFAGPPPKEPPKDAEPYAKWLYKNPQHPRTKYYNSILPQIYTESFPLLQTKFENYLFQERESRYKFVLWRNEIEKKVKSKLDSKNPASYGIFTSNTFQSFQNVHRQQCLRGIQEITELYDKVKGKVDELKTARSELYIGNSLKLGMKDKR